MLKIIIMQRFMFIWVSNGIFEIMFYEENRCVLIPNLQLSEGTFACRIVTEKNSFWREVRGQLKKQCLRVHAAAFSLHVKHRSESYGPALRRSNRGTSAMPPALLLLKRAALSGDPFSAHFTSDMGTRHISVSFFSGGTVRA